MRATPPRVWLPIAIAALALAGCGGDDAAAPEPPELETLVDYFPDDAYQMSAVDLVALRSELGLPGNTNPAKTPLSTAIDHSRATAALSAQVAGGGSIAVIATDQPFDEVAAGLEDDGWTRDGEALASPKAGDLIRFAAEAEEGQIVVATDRAELDAALAGENDGNPAGAMLGGIGGSVRFAFARIEDQGCVSAVAGGGDASTGRGTVLVDGGDDPDPAAFEAATADAEEQEVRFGQPEVRGNLIRVPFTDPGGPRGLAVNAAESSVRDLVFEPCP